MLESNQKQCKLCGEIKTRVEDGKYNYKDKRYRDESGKLWNGRVCPECTRIKSKERMQSKRISNVASNS